jgi:glycerophosphoryl diester phosphodiesterase
MQRVRSARTMDRITERPTRAARAFLPALGVVLGALLIVSAPTAEAGSNPWIVGEPLNIAHQGGEDEFPSNTLFAFHRALRAGADMLELDIGVTKDGKVVVMHDTSVDRTTNGHGLIASKTLKQIKRLDAAYWFSKQGPDHYEHGRPRHAYRFRGIATGEKRPPKGFKAGDFKVPTLRKVLRTFPDTPINIEIKGRTEAEETEEYLENAEVLAALLSNFKRPDLIVASFRQQAVELFHELLPRIGLSPGIDGFANWFLTGGSPGAGVVAFQVPITFEFGAQLLQITTKDSVAQAHEDGYAWHNWFGGADRDDPPTWATLIEYCVNGIMTSRPKKLEKVLGSHPAPTSCPSG